MADGFDDDMTRCPCCDGEGYFYHGDEPKSPWGDAATIARLTAELDEARASAAAAYERAARVAEGWGNCARDDDMAREIRALATEAESTALEETVKKAVDAETRACIEEVCKADSMELAVYGTSYIQDRLTARLDQRKEAGEC